jgi:broad specificity phosphatase PhoE
MPRWYSPRVPDPTSLILVRHGETPANTGGVWHGSTDTPLSERGCEQARLVARHLAETEPPADALYTSPLQRASNTAREIGTALGLVPGIEREIAEYHLGSWEGRLYRELLDQEDFWTRIRRDPDFAPEGGESVRQVAERFVRAVRRIAELHAGRRVILVSHGGAMAIGLGWMLDGKHASWKRVMNNCAISELVFEPAPRLVRFNESDHLTGAEPIDPRDLEGDSEAR